MARALSFVLAAAILALGAGAVTLAGAGPAVAKEKTDKDGKPLRGVIYGHRHGGYSYKYVDTMGTGQQRRFIDPSVTRQSSSGPFDNGFFFDSGIGPHGGESPYMQ